MSTKIPITVYNEKKSKYSASHEDQLALQRNITQSIHQRLKHLELPLFLNIVS